MLAMQETLVQSLGQEGPWEKEIATHSSILAWRASWMEEPGRLQSMGFKESDTTEATQRARLIKDPKNYRRKIKNLQFGCFCESCLFFILYIVKMTQQKPKM